MGTQGPTVKESLTKGVAHFHGRATWRALLGVLHMGGVVVAELLILLRRDPHSGKQNIVVKLDSDPDALPIEHEQLHRALVEKLIGTGLNPDDLGELVVEREAEAAPAAPPGERAETERQRAAEGPRG